MRIRKNISVVNSNGIDVGDVFGFMKKSVYEPKFTKRLTRMFGLTMIEDFDGDSLFVNFPAYLSFFTLMFSVMFNTMVTPLFL